MVSAISANTPEHALSSLFYLQALPEQGKLVACDRDPRALQLAQTAFAKGGVAHKVSMLHLHSA